MRDSSSDESGFNRKKEKESNNYAYGEKHEETDTSRPEFSVFHSRLGDYLHAVRGIGFLSTKKREHCQIRKLEKAASNS